MVPVWAAAHRDHPLAAPEVVEQVDRRVVDGEVGVRRRVRRLPGPLGSGLGGAGQFGIAGVVVGNAVHPARQLVRGVAALAAVLRGEQVFDGAEPMGVEDDERLRLELVEHFVSEPAESGNQADLLALVQLPPHLLGQHDRRDVGEQAEADNRHLSYFPVPRESVCSPAEGEADPPPAAAQDSPWGLERQELLGGRRKDAQRGIFRCRRSRARLPRSP